MFQAVHITSQLCEHTKVAAWCTYMCMHAKQYSKTATSLQLSVTVVMEHLKNAVQADFSATGLKDTLSCETHCLQCFVAIGCWLASLPWMLITTMFIQLSDIKYMDKWWRSLHDFASLQMVHGVVCVCHLQMTVHPNHTLPTQRSKWSKINNCMCEHACKCGCWIQPFHKYCSQSSLDKEDGNSSQKYRSG
jgi:hypothetical protein